MDRVEGGKEHGGTERKETVRQLADNFSEETDSGEEANSK